MKSKKSNISKIPTALEFARTRFYHSNGNISKQDEVAAKLLIEFTKFHVQAALEAQSKKIIEAWDFLPGNKYYSALKIEEWLKNNMFPTIDELRNKNNNSYPLSNIK